MVTGASVVSVAVEVSVVPVVAASDVDAVVADCVVAAVVGSSVVAVVGSSTTVVVMTGGVWVVVTAVANADSAVVSSVVTWEAVVADLIVVVVLHSVANFSFSSVHGSEIQ